MKNSTWVQDKENRLSKIEQKISSGNLGTFVGTMEEYEQAVADGIIKNGMLIAITKLK